MSETATPAIPGLQASVPTIATDPSSASEPSSASTPDTPPAPPSTPEFDPAQYVPISDFQAMQKRLAALEKPEVSPPPTVPMPYETMAMRAAKEELGQDANPVFLQQYETAAQSIQALEYTLRQTPHSKHQEVVKQIDQWRLKLEEAKTMAWAARFRAQQETRSEIPSAEETGQELRPEDKVELYRTGGAELTATVAKHMPDLAVRFQSGELSWAEDVAAFLHPQADIDAQVASILHILNKHPPKAPPDGGSSPPQTPAPMTAGAPPANQHSSSQTVPPKTPDEKIARDMAVLAKLHQG